MFGQLDTERRQFWAAVYAAAVTRGEPDPAAVADYALNEWDSRWRSDAEA